MSYTYQNGFGNHFSTEAKPGALPPHQNSPQVRNFSRVSLFSFSRFAPSRSGCTWPHEVERMHARHGDQKLTDFFQVPPFGLYTEQLSGTAFTMPRKVNERTWLYRIRPSVGHKRFQNVGKNMGVAFAHANVEQMRWAPFKMPEQPTDFVDGMHAVMGAVSLSNPPVDIGNFF